MEPLAYIEALNVQLTYLFAYARKINEVDTAAGLMPEVRGLQDGGWSTAATAHEVYRELKALGSKGEPLTRPELRQVLCLYAQLAEAGGVYEGLLNTMQVAQLKPYSMWPFQDLVRVQQVPPHAAIGPNANAMFRRLAAVATEIGMPQLARLLELAFRDDIRNGMAHADYILVPTGLRLRRRNGGQPLLVTNAQILTALQIALFFFELLQSHKDDLAKSYRPARTVVGRFSANPPMPVTIELTDDNRFGISTQAAGPQPDAAYERQSRINDRLGGRIFAAYVRPSDDIPELLLAAISTAGFDLLVIDLETADRFDVLVAEVDQHGLWDQTRCSSSPEYSLLMVSPDGFRWVAAAVAFREWLPAFDKLVVS